MHNFTPYATVMANIPKGYFAEVGLKAKCIIKWTLVTTNCVFAYSVVVWKPNLVDMEQETNSGLPCC